MPVLPADHAPVLLHAGLAHNRLQAVECGEPCPVLLYKSLRGISPLGLKVLLMEELPVEYVPRHELACPPGEATRAVDQHQSGEATHQEGAELHSPGVDVIKLQVFKLYS